MFPRYCDTRGMDHVRLDPTRTQPTCQPNAIATSFEGKRNSRDLFTGPDCLIAPAMQQAKQPFGTRLQLLARLTLNAGKHPGNQPARLAHLDDGNDRAILVQGDEGSAQVVGLGHQGTPSVGCSDDGAISSPPAPYHLFAAQHSSKAEPDQADSLACHILPRRWCGCEKSAAFVSVLNGDGHWVEYNDPVFGERMPEATACGPVRRESHDGRDDAP